MKNNRHRILLVALVAMIVAAGLCATQWRKGHSPSPTVQRIDPLKMILSRGTGETETDRQIVALQERIRETPNETPLFERLGWLFVTKARLSSDPGYYTLAEQTADAMDARPPDDTAALLLRGHVAHAMHRFSQAEEIARTLTTRREFVFDYALLGDALMEQ